MMKQKHGKIRFLVVIAALVISGLAIVISRQFIEQEMQKQLYENLKDVAEQNVDTVESLLNEKQNLLFKIADEINDKEFSFDSEEEIWEIVEWLKNYNNIYDFKRMGIIAIDGMAYATDGQTAKLSDEPYQYGVQGIANISSLNNAILYFILYFLFCCFYIIIQKLNNLFDLLFASHSHKYILAIG